MMWSLCLLPGGLGRFVPCSIGANHCRLRDIGWEKCGHGLTSRPRESASMLFLDELLGLICYPPGSGRALLAGTLLLGIVLLALLVEFLFGLYQFPGHVAGLVAADLAARDSEAEVAKRSVHFVSVSGPDRKRIRLNRKSPAHLVGLNMHVRHWCFGVDCKRRRCNQHDLGNSLVHPRTGLG